MFSKEETCASSDDREFCPAGYQQLARIDNPLDGTVLLVCALH